MTVGPALLESTTQVSLWGHWSPWSQIRSIIVPLKGRLPSSDEQSHKPLIRTGMTRFQSWNVTVRMKHIKREGY